MTDSASNALSYARQVLAAYDRSNSATNDVGFPAKFLSELVATLDSVAEVLRQVGPPSYSRGDAGDDYSDLVKVAQVLAPLGLDLAGLDSSSEREQGSES